MFVTFCEQLPSGDFNGIHTRTRLARKQTLKTKFQLSHLFPKRESRQLQSLDHSKRVYNMMET